MRKDGTRFFGSGLMMRMDGDDETSRLLKILRDRTLEEQARTALAESQERLRLATDAAGLGVFEWNLETGTGLWENTRMYDIFGRHPEEGPLDAEGVVARLVPGDLERLRTALQEHPDKGEPLHLVVGITDEDDASPRFLELWGRFGRDTDGSRTRLIGVVADVTAQRRAQAALIEADRRKDAFLATLAHELRNPLAPIRHALEILRRAEHDPALTARARTLMERQLSQMVRLIDDLLDLSRITLGKISLRHQIVSLDDMVRNAIETCQPILDAAGQRLDVQVPAEDVHVLGDLTRLAQVLTNLLNNASKFSGPGQSISLVVEASERPGDVPGHRSGCRHHHRGTADDLRHVRAGGRPHAAGARRAWRRTRAGQATGRHARGDGAVPTAPGAGKGVPSRSCCRGCPRPRCGRWPTHSRR